MQLEQCWPLSFSNLAEVEFLPSSGIEVVEFPPSSGFEVSLWQEVLNPCEISGTPELAALECQLHGRPEVGKRFPRRKEESVPAAK